MPILYLLAPVALFALVVATAFLVFTQPPSANSPLAGRRQAGTTSQITATTTSAASRTPSVIALTPSPSPTVTLSPTPVTPTATPSATVTPLPTEAPPTSFEEEGGERADQQAPDDQADTALHLLTTDVDSAEQGQEQQAPQARGGGTETAVTDRSRSRRNGNETDVPAASAANGGDGSVASASDDSTADPATNLEAEDDGAIGSGTGAPEPTATRPTLPPAPALRTAIVHSPAGFTGTHLRAAPGQGAASLRLLPNGTRVQLLGPLAVADGFRWLQVRTLDGLTGWAVAVAL